MSQPEIGQRRFRFAMNVLPESIPLSSSSDHDGKVIVLMGGAISEARAQREDRIVQQGRPLRFFNRAHAFHEVGKYGYVEVIQLQQVFKIVLRIVSHAVMAFRPVKDSLPIGRCGPPLRSNHHGGHMSQARLQRSDEKVTHQLDVFVTR